MTDLDVTKGCILEVAVVVTDSNLNIVAEGPEVVIHQPDDILQSMNEWCITHHGMVKWTVHNLIVINCRQVIIIQFF
jgi:oligoribonuclease